MYMQSWLTSPSTQSPLYFFGQARRRVCEVHRSARPHSTHTHAACVWGDAGREEERVPAGAGERASVLPGAPSVLNLTLSGFDGILSAPSGIRACRTDLRSGCAPAETHPHSQARHLARGRLHTKMLMANSADVPSFVQIFRPSSPHLCSCCSCPEPHTRTHTHTLTYLTIVQLCSSLLVDPSPAISASIAPRRRRHVEDPHSTDVKLAGSPHIATILNSKMSTIACARRGY